VFPFILENRPPSLPQEIDFRFSPIVLAVSEILQLKIGISDLSCVSKGHIFDSVQSVHPSSPSVLVVIRRSPEGCSANRTNCLQASQAPRACEKNPALIGPHKILRSLSFSRSRLQAVPWNGAPVHHPFG
jgi:hypothetical protein